jgi:hypothetical protein
MIPATHDPRETWDEKQQRELQPIFAEIEAYLDDASELDNPEIATSRIEELREAHGAYRVTRLELDAEARQFEEAEAALERAKQANAAGSVDAEEAVRLHLAEVAAASAVRARFARWREKVAATAAARETMVSHAYRPADRQVIAETRDFAKALLEGDSAKRAHELASAAGRASNATKAAWWPLAEALVRREFSAGLKKLKKREPDPRDWRRVEEWSPSKEDLEACFAKRRAAFEAERHAVAARIAELQNNLATLGAA